MNGDGTKKRPPEIFERSKNDPLVFCSIVSKHLYKLSYLNHCFRDHFYLTKLESKLPL